MAKIKDLGYRLEWEGLEELIEMFDNMDDNFTRILKQEFQDYVNLVEEGTKALAPHDEGDLEDSISSEVMLRPSGIIGTVGANTEYALRQHEQPSRSGSHTKYDNGAKFPDYYENGRGQGTISKGTWRGHAAGRKYLANAVKATQQDFTDMLERVLQRCIQEGVL